MKEVMKTCGTSVFAAGLAAACCASEAREGKPNVIMLITDDTGAEMLGFSGGKGVLTPNLDLLAKEGVVFSNYFVSSTVCTPSRFTYLTGLAPSRCEAPSFLKKSSGRMADIGFNIHLKEGQKTVADVFRDGGYSTAFVGKWHAGGAAGRITNSKYLPDESSDFREDDKLDDPAVAVKLEAEYKVIQDSIRSFGFDYVEGVNWGNTDDRKIRSQRFHNLDFQAKYSVEFLRKQGEGAKPFLMHLATSPIHGPNHLVSIEGDARITQRGIEEGLTGYLPGRKTIRERLEKAGLAVNHRTAGALWVDDLVGALVAELKRNGQYENTIFIFSTDHGPHDGKSSCYDGGVKVPALIVHPGHLKAGGRCDAFVQNNDWLPTLASACGMKIPEDMKYDGFDRWPQIAKGAGDDREELFFEMGYTRAIRTAKWKYIAFRLPEEKIEAMKAGKVKTACNHTGGTSSDWCYFQSQRYPAYFAQDQLYDVQNDPGEQRNLAGDPGHAAVLADMKARLASHLAKFANPFDLAKQDFMDSPEFMALAEKARKDDSVKNSQWFKEDAF